jgi:hypothetical protein
MLLPIEKAGNINSDAPTHWLDRCPKTGDHRLDYLLVPTTARTRTRSLFQGEAAHDLEHRFETFDALLRSATRSAASAIRASPSKSTRA